MSIRLAASAACLALLAGCLGDSGDLVRPGEPAGTVTVVNGAGIALDVVTISDCDAFTHGFNKLPRGEAIAPGARFSWPVSAGCWDVHAGNVGTSQVVEFNGETVLAGGETVLTAQP